MLDRKSVTASIFFYGGLWRRVLRDRLEVCSFFVSSCLQALGQGGMATAAGLLGGTLASAERPSVGWLWPWPNSSKSALVLSLVGLTSAVVKGGGSVWGATVQSRIAQNVANDVRIGVARTLLSAGASVPSNRLTARFAIRITEIERSVQEGILGGSRAVVQVVPLVLALLWVSPKLAMGAVLVLAPFGVISAGARRLWKRSHARALELSESAHQQVDDLVQHIDVWRTYGAGESVLAALERLGRASVHAGSRVEGGRAALSSANEILGAGAVALVVWLSLAVQSTIQTGAIVAFAAVFFMMYRPLRDLGDARTAMVRGRMALGALRDALATYDDSDPSEQRTGPPVPRRLWSLSRLAVEGLGVIRTDTCPDKRTLPLLSLDVAPGEIVAVVGPTGAGKTTLLRALLGLEPNVVGTIRYGDEEITHACVGPDSRPFAWAPQGSAVVSADLDDNLCLASGRSLGAAPPDANGQVPEIIRKAEQVLSLMGAGRLRHAARREMLGGAGRPLSGGEQKWIALGRALISNQPVLLLDEPTAGLDVEARGCVLRAIAQLRGHRSVLLVTHEQEPLHIADRVISIGASAQ